MPILTGLFIFGLYKATEKIWNKAFDAAWDPIDASLKARFTRWAGKVEEHQREQAFARAVEIAKANTFSTSPDPKEAKRILAALDGVRDPKAAEALAEESAKLMLFSAAPDISRMQAILQERLHWDQFWSGEVAPSPETVALVLADFLTNLREALLDQEPYQDLIQKDMRTALSEILVELRPVGYDTEATYRAQLAEMNRQLDFVGIPEIKERRPITVKDLFIHLRAEREVERPEISPDTLTQKSIAEGRTPAEVASVSDIGVAKERVELEAALKENQRLVILGDPGSGKTTLLKYLAVICAEGQSGHELGLKATDGSSLLPIFVPLRAFAAESANRAQDYNLLDYFYTYTHEHLSLNLQRGFFEGFLSDGSCLVCLDGLDEVWASDHRKKVTDAVRSLATRYPKNHYIVTSRLIGYEAAPLDRRNFVHHTVLPLEDEHIHLFIHKWYAIRERDPLRREEKTKNLIDTLERQPRIKDLARNPLLLTIITLVHRIEAELPHERVKLYDKCVTALVDTWEEVKGLTLEEKRRPFYRHKRRLLERLAFELHKKAEEPGRLQAVKTGELELLLTRLVMENKRLGFSEDPDGARDEARAFIRLERGRTGLLIERGEGEFSFPHLTFQEYLAACDIENRCLYMGVDAIWGEISLRLMDPHWREVMLLLLGSLNKYDDLPTLLVKRILQAGQADKFEPVLHRHLFLTARALADRVEIDRPLREQIIANLLDLAYSMAAWMVHPTIDALSWLQGDAQVINGLLGLVGDPQVEAGVRSAATRALGEVGRAEPAVLDSLLILAGDAQVDDWLRYAAAEALGKLGRHEDAARILLALAGDSRADDWVRYEAAEALAELGRAGPTVLDGLLAVAGNPRVQDGVRYDAARALGQLGRPEDAARTLLALAGDAQVEDRVRYDAARALEQLGGQEDAARTLLALAEDSQARDAVRSAAAEALQELGQAGSAVLDDLLALAGDSQVGDGVRSAAARALGELGRAEPAVLDGLLAVAGDPQVRDGVRSAAARALGKLGRAEPALLDGLLALAGDSQVGDGLRSAAAEALGELGRAGPTVLDGLLALAGNARVQDGVRFDAARALGQLGRQEDAARILLALAGNARVQDGVRFDAARALAELGRQEDAARILLALAGDAQVDDLARSDAAEALGELGRAEPAVLDGLLALAGDSQVEDWVRSAAAEALGKLGPAEPAVLDGLLALAGDSQVDDRVRYTAARALRALL